MSETESATNTIVRMAMSSGRMGSGALAAGMYLTAIAAQGIGATISAMYHAAKWAVEHRPQIEDKGEMSLSALRDKHDHVHVSPALDSAELEAVRSRLYMYGVDFAVEQVDGVAYVHMRADDVDTLTHAIEASDAEIKRLEAAETGLAAPQRDAGEALERDGETPAKEGQRVLDADGTAVLAEEHDLTRENPASPARPGDKQAKNAVAKRKQAAKTAPERERKSSSPTKTSQIRKNAPAASGPGLGR